MQTDQTASSAYRLPEELAVGGRFGEARYLLKRKLGRGEFTEVWLARDVRAEREVTLKFLRPDFLADAAVLARLDQETRRSAQLAHPAIARIYDFQCDYQSAAVVTEFVEGWSLATVKVDRPQKRFRIADITLWVHQLCVALDYAHHGFCLVHRSMKPSNILLDRREQLKVTDFGIDDAIRAAAVNLGQPISAGTIAYASPQQLQGADPSVLDDIYSLGATIYDLLMGTPPFVKGDLSLQILELTAPTMNERLAELNINDAIPAAWEEVIAACLAKDPGQRPHSASEIWRSLETATKAQQTIGLELQPRLQRISELSIRVRNFFGQIASKVRSLMVAGARTIRAQTRNLGSQVQKRLAALRKNQMLVLAATVTLMLS